MSNETNHISFEKALKVLELSLQGLSPKEIRYQVGLSLQTISVAKQMFPLFLGLRRQRNNAEPH